MEGKRDGGGERGTSKYWGKRGKGGRKKREILSCR